MKGWTVVTNSTKDRSNGVADREVYLHNKDHKNHVKTEALIQLLGGTQTMAKIAHNGAMAAAKIRHEGKGGRPPESYAVEFTLNLPKGYRPSVDEWQKITKHVVSKVAKKLKVDPRELQQLTYATLHQQDQTPDPHPDTGVERGTGDHAHIVIGKFLSNGLCLRDLQRKTITNTVKDAFNYATLYLGYDWQEYANTKLMAQEHANTKHVPTWKIKAAREHNEIDRRMDALSETITDMEMRANEIEKREQDLAVREAELNEKIAEQKVVDKLIKNFETQGNKWLLAYESGDAKQMNRQKNRLNKSLTALDAFGLLSDDPVTMEAAVIMSRVELMVDKVNYCKPQTIAIPSVSHMKLG